MTREPAAAGALGSSSAVQDPRGERRRRLHDLLVILPLYIALVVLWLMLWGHIDVISVATGIGFAVLVTSVFYLPPVRLSGRFSLPSFARFVVVILGQLLRASVQVAWWAVRPAPVPPASIVRVQLHTRSDFILALTADALSIVPGSIVVEVDRYHSALYLHVIGERSASDRSSTVREVLGVEELLVRSLGTRDDIWRINTARAELGLPKRRESARQRAHEARRAEEVRLGALTGDARPLPQLHEPIAEEEERDA